MSRTVLDALNASIADMEEIASHCDDEATVRADVALLRELRDALSNPTDLALDCASYGYATSAPNGECQCCPCSLARLLGAAP